MSDLPDPRDEDIPVAVHLGRIAREMKMMREMMVKVVSHMIDAESEIPEKMRRFSSYMHCIHSMSYMYSEVGQPVPDWVLREMERCDDRYRQILKELHLDGGTFERVRREMAKDPNNRFDHTRLLTNGGAT